MSNQIYIHERVPASPYLNQNAYIVISMPGLATFTGGYVSVASVISPIQASGASYVAFYTAGSIPVGTWDIKAFVVKGAMGTFTNGVNITIQDSEIAEPVATIYSLIKNNLGGSFASTLVTTGWYDTNVQRPQISVTRNRWTDMSGNLFDTFRQHEEEIYIDTWVSGRDTGTSQFGTTSIKRARKLLDDEVKRIVNANRKAPSSKLRWMILRGSQVRDEVTQQRKVMRTTHTLRLLWDETIS